MQLVSQYAILTRAARTAADGTGDYARIAADLRTYGLRPPCLVTGRLATPVAYQAGCASGQVTGHNQNTTVAKVLATDRGVRGQCGGQKSALPGSGGQQLPDRQIPGVLQVSVAQARSLQVSAAQVRPVQAGPDQDCPLQARVGQARRLQVGVSQDRTAQVSAMQLEHEGLITIPGPSAEHGQRCLDRLARLR